MGNICIIEKDEKTRGEILDYIKSYTADQDLIVHAYKSLEAFAAESHIFELTVPAKKEVAHIDVLIVDYECLGNTATDLAKIRKGIETKKLYKEIATRVILTSFEKVKLTLEGLPIDDYIFKPIEKQLFLQKLEIALNAPNKIDPTFLALQPIKEKIGVGKRAKLSHFNDFSIKILNPVTISPGAYIRFFSERMGDKKIGTVLARSMESVKLSDNTFECRFDYFGVLPQQLGILRKRLAEIKSEKEAVKSGETATDQALQVVIIDVDKQEIENLKTYLESNLEKVNLLHFPSYTSFLAACFVKDSNKSSVDIKILPKAAFEDLSNIQLELDDDFNIKKMIKWDKEEGTLLGYTKEDWLDKGDLLARALDERQKQNFQDLIEIIKTTGDPNKEKFVYEHNPESIVSPPSDSTEPAASVRSLLELDIKKTKTGFEVVVTDKTTEEPSFDYVNLGANQVNLERLDLLFIDENFILEPNLWVEGLKEKVAGLKNPAFPKVIVTGKARGKEPPTKFQRRDFFDFLFKPIDKPTLGKKLLTSYLSGLTKLKESGVDLAEVQYAKMDEFIMLATEIDILSLSEFGIAVRFGSPIRKDMFIQFYLKSLIGMDDHEPIYARCYASEEEKDSGRFVCYFTFLGVSDEIFKQIRIWMREYYIKSKDSE